MARAATDISPGFVVSVGDNVYDVGVRSLDDPLFNTVFEVRGLMVAAWIVFQ